MLPGTWMGSRSQSLKSTMAYDPFGPSLKRFECRAGSDNDLRSGCFGARQSLQPSKDDGPPGHRPFLITHEERSSAALHNPKAPVQQWGEHLSSEARTLDDKIG